MYEKVILNQAPMTIACNLRYLGGWDKDEYIPTSPGQKKKKQKQKMGNTC
jgi:hypothetical protein